MAYQSPATSTATKLSEALVVLRTEFCRNIVCVKQTELILFHALLQPWHCPGRRGSRTNKVTFNRRRRRVLSCPVHSGSRSSIMRRVTRSHRSHVAVPSWPCCRALAGPLTAALCWDKFTVCRFGSAVSCGSSRGMRRVVYLSGARTWHGLAFCLSISMVAS